MVEVDGQSIEIVTVHSSKGLEWPVVIPINRTSMPRRPEPFVYRRSVGRVTPPSLQGEKTEKRNENLRLLYVACTRAMELLVIPDFTWSDDTSWVKQFDLRLGEVPELNVTHLPRGTFTAPAAIENQQSAPLFAEERLPPDCAFDRIRWIRPSDSDQRASVSTLRRPKPG